MHPNPTVTSSRTDESVTHSVAHAWSLSANRLWWHVIGRHSVLLRTETEGKTQKSFQVHHHNYVRRLTEPESHKQDYWSVQH